MCILSISGGWGDRTRLTTSTTGIVADEQHWGLAQREHDPSHVPGETEASTWLQSFCDLAIKHQIDIVAGTIVEKAPEKVDGKDVLSNVAHYINKEGKVLGRYKKVHLLGRRGVAGDTLTTDSQANLWWPEKDYLTPGRDGHQVFDTAYGKTGLLVCTSLLDRSTLRSSADPISQVGTSHGPRPSAPFVYCASIQMY